MKEILIEIMPALVSALITIIGLVVTLVKTSVTHICKKINEKDSIIARSAVSDPKGYYIPDQALADLKVLYHGQEIDLKDCTFIKKEVSKNETKKNSERC